MGRLKPGDVTPLGWISDGYVLLDHELRCTLINEEASAQLGLPAQGLLGKRLPDVQAEPARTGFAALRAAAEDAFTRQIPRHVDARDDASGRWLALRIYPSPDGVLALIVDISTRKRAEAEAAAHLEEFRGLVEQAPAFLWVVDPEMRVRRMFGPPSLLRQVGSDVLVGRTIDEGMALGHVPPDVQELWREMHRRALRGGVGEYLAHYVGLAVEARVQPLRDVTGAIVGILGIGIDVTEQERSREKERAHLWLLESLDRVNRTMQGASDLDRMMRDVLDVVLDVFDGDRAWLLYPCEPDATSWIITMFRSRDAAQESPAERHVVLESTAAVKTLRALRESDGPLQFGDDAGRLLPDMSSGSGTQSMLAMAIYPKGDQPHFFAIGQTTRARVWTSDEQRLFQEIGRRLADGLTSLKILHDLRASERALRVSEARFRIFADQASDLFFLHDEEGTIVDVNRQACESLGYTREELLGMSSEQLEGGVHQRLYGRIGVTRDVGEVLALETRLRRKDGTMFPAEARGRWFTEGGRRYMLYLVRAIRERKQLEAELLQSQKMEAIGRLAGGIAHDFNNLLTVIAGYSDFIGEASAPDDERRRDAEEIRRAADRAALLTQQLLAFSRKQAMHPTIVDVNVIVEETSRMLRRLIGEDVRLEWRPAREVVAVLIDAGQLQQVLMNLAVNARDAMPLGGSLTLEAGQIAIEREEPAQPTPLAPGTYMRIAITDTGEGMSPDVMARAFEPFFTTKGVGKGTGLGLSTVYGIVSQSRGHLRVDSAPGRGTTFEIFLPAVESARTADEATVAATPPATRGAETILLVEDEDMVRRLAEVSLLRAGYRVLVANGGTEALRIAHAHPGVIDLVVTDVVMPELPGPELVTRLEAVRPGVPVLYVSGYADETVMRYGVSEERVSFLAKPFTPDALTHRVREVLDAKE